jgi:hypothetical protein
MPDSKRLTAFHVTDVDPRGANVTFTLESDGEKRDTYFATDEVLGGLVHFVLEVDYEARRRRLGIPSEARKAIDSLLYPSKELDLLIDVTGECALLRARTGLGTTLQIEMSEELLSRLEKRIPAILAELRARKADRSH